MSPTIAYDVAEFMASHFEDFGKSFRVDQVNEEGAVVTMVFNRTQLRPGGTISGPAMMTLADTAGYVAMLAHAGLRSAAVTTTLNIHFLRRPPPADLRAHAVIRKLGLRSAVVAVAIFTDGQSAPVADATVCYAISSSPKDSTV
jgi:uncharacterized protein (TIGR00369 family)